MSEAFDGTWPEQNAVWAWMEQYANILRKLVEAQDEIDIEAEKPLHQRSKGPIAKKQEAIKEARRVLGGE